MTQTPTNQLPTTQTPTKLRTGWTTGTCASAAARAATIGLRDGVAVDRVEVELPEGRGVMFDVEPGPHSIANECVVVKDAGDDPDCTDGARVTALVEWATLTSTMAAATGVEIRAGDGVGTITLPGLGLPVGAPAVNPVPRRMIEQAVAAVTDRPVVVTLSVPGGQKMAEKTTNERLGIVGGISILGTTGIVRPFSTAAYRASVVQQIDVAAAQGHRRIALATGSRSERWVLDHLDLAPVCVVEVGDFTGIALRRAAAAGIEHIVFVGMAGKIAKLAAGVMMTHFHRSRVDTELLAEVRARVSAAPAAIVAAATATATARHFYEVCVDEGCVTPLAVLCARARDACRAHVAGSLAVDVVMVDFDGAAEVARA